MPEPFRRKLMASLNPLLAISAMAKTEKQKWPLGVSDPRPATTTPPSARICGVRPTQSERRAAWLAGWLAGGPRDGSMAGRIELPITPHILQY